MKKKVLNLSLRESFSISFNWLVANIFNFLYVVLIVSAFRSYLDLLKIIGSFEHREFRVLGLIMMLMLLYSLALAFRHIYFNLPNLNWEDEDEKKRKS